MRSFSILTKTDIKQLVNSDLDSLSSSKHIQERYIMADFLARTYVEQWSGQMLTLTHDDKPDFRLDLKDDQKTIGVEVTRACDETHKQIQYRLTKKVTQPYCYSTNAFKPTMSNAHSKKLLQMIISNVELKTYPLMGKAPERRWVKYIKKISDKKKIDFNKKEFEKLDINFLLINVEIPGMVAVRDFQFCMADLKQTFKDYWKTHPTFDAIFIIHEDILIALNKESVFMH